MIRNFFGLDDESQDWDEQSQFEENEHIPSEYVSRSSVPTQNLKSKVIPMNQHNPMQKASIHVIEPRVFTESERIADYLMGKGSVLLNFKRMEKDQATRVIDFIAGTVYAINGDIQQVGEGIFLCTPANFEIASRESENESSEYYF